MKVMYHRGFVYCAFAKHAYEPRLRPDVIELFFLHLGNPDRPQSFMERPPK